MPILQSTGDQVLSDLLTLHSVETIGSAARAVATSPARTFLGSRYTGLDYFFLPHRTLEPKPFPDWQEVSSEEGRYSVVMPGAPTQTTDTGQTPGGSADVHYAVSEGQGRQYGVSYVDYPAGFFEGLSLNVISENMSKMLSSQNGYSILGDSAVRAGGHEGRELRAESQDGKTSMRIRLFVVKDRMYDVTVLGAGEEAFSPEPDKFFDSYTLLK
jgi:hypothetical protein